MREGKSNREKFEIRSTKSLPAAGRRNKHECSKYKCPKQEMGIHFENLNFGFVSSFDIRISNFISEEGADRCRLR